MHTFQKLLQQGKTREELKNTTLSVRIWLSSGAGDFWIYSLVISRYWLDSDYLLVSIPRVHPNAIIVPRGIF